MDDGQRDVPTNVLAVVAGLLAGLGLGAVGILAWVDRNESDDSAPVANQSAMAVREGSDAESNEPSEPTEPTADAAASSTADSCVNAARALQAPLEAAASALEQWGVHIEAMNQLVVGEITLQQATEFWDRTRIGAQRRVERFNTAWAGAREQDVSCPSPLLLAPADEAVRPCAQQVADEIRVLEAARTSIDMWAQHVRHMDMLRLGELSPSKATSMWLSMWKRGDRELETYRTAVRDRERGGCTEGASAGDQGEGHSH